MGERLVEIEKEGRKWKKKMEKEKETNEKGQGLRTSKLETSICLFNAACFLTKMAWRERESEAEQNFRIKNDLVQITLLIPFSPVDALPF